MENKGFSEIFNANGRIQSDVQKKHELQNDGNESSAEFGKMKNRLGDILGFAELKEKQFWRAILGEILATLLYIFTVCGSGASKPDNLHSSLVTGLTVALLANTFWDISGGHFNPAVTIGLTVVGKVKLVRCVLYVVAQCVGSVIAAGLLYAYIPPNIRGELGVLKHHPDITPGVGFLIEMTISFQMMLVIVSSTDPVRGHVGFQAPFAIGLSVTIALMMGIPFTSAAANPIRAFGPAVVLNLRENQWVYWAGPISGGILGSLSYKYVLRQTTSKATITATTTTSKTTTTTDEQLHINVEEGCE